MLKLKRFSSGQWFEYPGAEKVRFLIKPLQLSDGIAIRSKIREKVATEVKDPTSKRPLTVLMEDVDSGKFSKAVFDHILQDFEGISIDGQEGATKEELREAIFNEPSLREFISEKSEWLREQGTKKLEDEIKNSPSSQNG